jgi:hypothetical protein
MPNRMTSPPVTRLAAFFKNADTQFGIFYPKNYLLCAFSTLEDAKHAKHQLSTVGRDDEDVIVVSGDEVVQFAEDHLIADGLWGMLMTELSRVFGTEALYADKDLAAAKEGAAFLAVYCPTEDAKTEAWKCLDPIHPLVARHYSAIGIEHLAGES